MPENIPNAAIYMKNPGHQYGVSNAMYISIVFCCFSTSRIVQILKITIKNFN